MKPTPPELPLGDTYEETVFTDHLDELGKRVNAAGGLLFSFGYVQGKGWECEVHWPHGKPHDFQYP